MTDLGSGDLSSEVKAMEKMVQIDVDDIDMPELLERGILTHPDMRSRTQGSWYRLMIERTRMSPRGGVNRRLKLFLV